MNSADATQDCAWVGFPIRKSPGQSLFAAHRGLSQLATSFIAVLRQGIHRTPLIACCATTFVLLRSSHFLDVFFADVFVMPFVLLLVSLVFRVIATCVARHEAGSSIVKEPRALFTRS